MSTPKRYLFRPSSAPALMLCGHYDPGDNDDENDSDDNEDTNLGKQIHAYVEDLVVGKKPTAGTAMDQKCIEACEYSASQIVRIFKKFIPDFDIKEVEVEKRCAVVADNLQLITEGTPDLCCRDVEIDVKGCLDFFVENHYHKPQTKIYALARMRDHGHKLIHVAEVYVMPRKELLYDVTYDDAAATVECVVAKINDPMKQHQPNEYCKWCVNLMNCPAINERILTVQANFGPIAGWIKNIQAITDPQQMSVALKFAKIMEAWVKVVKESARVMSEANSGDETYIPGFKRTKKSGEAEIADLNKAFQLSGCNQQQFMAACKLSLPKLAEQFKASHEPISLDAAEKEIKGRLNDVIKPNTGSYYLRATKKENKPVF